MSNDIRSRLYHQPDSRHPGHPIMAPGLAPIPIWLIVLCSVWIFWAGVAFNGGLSASYFSAENYGPYSAPEQRERNSPVANGDLEKPSITEVGKASFLQNCSGCHQADGLGVLGAYPPLARSPYINGGTRRLVMIVLKGLQGTVTLEGREFNGTMPAWEKALTDQKIAAILTYVRQNFGNDAAPVTIEQIATARKEFSSRTEPWVEADLLAVPADAELPRGPVANPRRASSDAAVGR